MASKAEMSQVKMKVQHDAVLLQEFTLEDLIRTTGFTRDSVSTVVQRMKNEGFLISSPLPQRAGPESKPGRPPVLYCLTDDLEKRMKLSKNVQAFYPASPAPANQEPQSKFYAEAQAGLGIAEKASGKDCDFLLDAAEDLLDKAEKEEGWTFASEAVLSYLDFERARLTYLRGKQEEACDEFTKLRAFFEGINDTGRASTIDQYLLIMRWSLPSEGAAILSPQEAPPVQDKPEQYKAVEPVEAFKAKVLEHHKFATLRPLTDSRSEFDQNCRRALNALSQRGIPAEPATAKLDGEKRLAAAY